MRRGMVKLLLMMVCFAGLGGVAEAATLTWDDLKPEMAPIGGGLRDLHPVERYKIGVISRNRETGDEAGEGASSDARIRAEALADELMEQGLDVDRLIQEFRLAQTEAKRRRDLLVEDLDGQSIRLAGYLLPLDYSDQGTSEFLLVPYVGACIHVPPPPKNQIVYVRLKQSFKAESLFVPVEVAGLLQTKSTRQSLELVDGRSEISVGYTLDGASVTVLE